MKNPIKAFVFGALTVLVVVIAFWLGQNSQSLSLSKPALPVTVTFRKALTGQGYVIGIHNTSNKPMPFSVTLKNPTFKTERAYAVTIDPFGLGEIGYLQGWIGAIGDTIHVESSGFAAYDGSIPP